MKGPPLPLARRHIPELDGLRAVSVLIVISLHMHDTIWGWLSGELGVIIFFVLSGYLITTLALEEERQTGFLSLKAFYIRRACRIFPLYYLVLGVYCLLIFGLHLTPEKRQPLSHAMPYFLFYLQEIPNAFGPGKILPFYQSWSLGIEEKFYLIWPALAFVLLRGRNQLRLAVVVMLAIVFASTPYWGIGRAAICLVPYYPILVGCALAIWLHGDRAESRWDFFRARPIHYASVALVLVLHFSVHYWRSLTEVYPVAVAFFLATILAAPTPLGKLLATGPLVFVGQVSYGVYLVHMLCLNVVEKVFVPGSGRVAQAAAAYGAACVVSVGLSYMLARLVERPMIRRGRRWSAKYVSSKITTSTA
jgi:peptidoglycan/LPS O-acetylase OafA/YrhL